MVISSLLAVGVSPTQTVIIEILPEISCCVSLPDCCAFCCNFSPVWMITALATAATRIRAMNTIIAPIPIEPQSLLSSFIFFFCIGFHLFFLFLYLYILPNRLNRRRVENDQAADPPPSPMSITSGIVTTPISSGESFSTSGRLSVLYPGGIQGCSNRSRIVSILRFCTRIVTLT